MKRDMYYFSDVQYKTILTNRDDFDLKDSVLVSCQQMIETLLKGLLIDRDGTCERSHNLKALFRDFDLEHYNRFRELLSDLTDCYFDCRYAGDDYIDYSREEFTGIVNSSLELRDYLLLSKSSEMNKSNQF